MNVIKIGNVELTENDAENLYTSGKKYLVTYSKIYEMKYSPAQKRYYGSVICTAGTGSNYARRGRFYAYTAKDVNWLLGCKLLNE